MSSYLSDHKVLCIFPEGTSTDGKSVLPFRSNLLQAAIQSKTRVIPICIAYKEKGRYSDVTAFIGEMGLIDSIKKCSNHQTWKCMYISWILFVMWILGRSWRTARINQFEQLLSDII